MIRRAPWCALVLVAGAGAASWVADWPEHAIFDRAAVEAGEPWRLATGHLVHASARLALFDLGALAALGAWLELRSRATFFAAMLAGGALASAAVWWLRPDLATYQGASALASAAFAALALSLARDGGRARWLALVALAAFALKLALELCGAGLGLATAPGLVVVPEAHAAGALGGALAAAALRSRSRAGTRR